MLKHFNFKSHVKNIPALRAKGLHNPELDTRARSALVIKKENYNTLFESCSLVFSDGDCVIGTCCMISIVF